MKKTLLLAGAVLFALIAFRCTKDDGDGTIDTGKTGEYAYSLDGRSDGAYGGGSTGNGSGDQDPINVDPGQITAAEWNDLLEWDFWLNLEQHAEFNTAQENWKFYPTNRYSFLVKNIASKPVADCEIELRNLQGETLWKARTDNEGNAVLWAGMNAASTGSVTAVVKFKSEDINIVDPKEHAMGINEVILATGETSEPVADVLFVVDATGSMSDEINYLKSELLDVINRVEDIDDQLSLRVGSVFYRDEGDEYLTRVSPFSTSLTTTLSFINEQSADGGGDYEEAVHTALNTAITQLSWSKTARARLLFLLLDAPPHLTLSIVSDLNNIIKETAEKGIKIIPISASGINKDTEFLFRFFATATNGTYVFITNDSGIGGDHIEATVGEYEVELLNDLIVRLISKYTAQ